MVDAWYEEHEDCPDCYGHWWCGWCGSEFSEKEWAEACRCVDEEAV